MGPAFIKEAMVQVGDVRLLEEGENELGVVGSLDASNAHTQVAVPKAQALVADGVAERGQSQSSHRERVQSSVTCFRVLSLIVAIPQLCLT